METCTIRSDDASRPNPQFLCKVCGKYFDQKKSQIRHSSYCRKRAKDPPLPRKKSCLGCTKAKCQCDRAFPTCSMCLKRNLKCLYHSKASLDQPSFDGRVQSAIFPSTGASLLDLDTGPSSVSDLSEDYLPAPDLFDDVLLPLLQNSVRNSEDDLNHDGKSTPGNMFPSDSIYPIDYSNLGDLPDFVPQPIYRATRSFEPRNLNNRQLFLNRKYVTSTLGAYIKGILPGNTPPPFLHPQCFANEFDQNVLEGVKSLPDPLAKCAGIVALWSVKNKNNAVFVWRSIRTEQERLLYQCNSYDDWNALAMLQAVSIYFLLRIAEHDEDLTDFDIPLIQTMVQVAMRFRVTSLRNSTLSVSRQLTWEDWIFAESLQRSAHPTLFVIFIVDFLFDISAGTTKGCNGAEHLMKMPLPCSNNIWKAKTKVEWEKEYVAQLNLRHQIHYEHPTFNHLIGHASDIFSPKDSVDDWMASVDGLGMLLISAASLAGEIGFFAA